MLFLLIYCMIQSAASSRQDDSLQQVQTAVQAGPYDPEDSMVLKWQWQIEILFGSFQLIWRNQHSHLGFCSKALPCCVCTYSLFEEWPLDCYWSLQRLKAKSWVAKLPTELSWPVWTGWCLTHKTINLDMHSSTLFSNESSI